MTSSNKRAPTPVLADEVRNAAEAVQLASLQVRELAALHSAHIVQSAKVTRWLMWGGIVSCAIAAAAMLASAAVIVTH